jgi:hypothetical protein
MSEATKDIPLFAERYITLFEKTSKMKSLKSKIENRKNEEMIERHLKNS